MSEVKNLLTEEGEINPETIRRVSRNIAKKNFDEVREIGKNIHYVDFADLIKNLPPINRIRIVEIMGDDFDARIWMELDEPIRDAIASRLSLDFLTHQVAKLDSHDALFLLHHLPESEQRDILTNREVPDWEKAEIEESLHYKENTAGHIMHHDVVKVQGSWTIKQLNEYLHEQSDLPKSFLEVYLLEEDDRPLGSIPLSRIARADNDTVLKTMIVDKPIFLPVDMKQNEIAFRFKKYHLVSAGVVNEIGKLVGRITSDDVVGIISDEAEKEFKQLGGVSGDSMFNNIGSATRGRFKWLFVNLITAVMASIVISIFDATIEKMVALAVLMPIVASMGGVAGTQTLTIAVRAIATHDLRSSNQMRVVYRELVIGSLNGVIFAGLLGIAAGFWAGIGVGAVLAFALVITMVVAALSGVIIPVALEKLGADPALSSGVFVTTVTDVIGFFMFLGTATYFLLPLLSN